ncbi:unnamed protein product [Cylicostephanus goldi]|uniref:Guanylate cyclase domain-containing protein n=1 Tax=Cylicostephanus goldi TaxID=71465 RepID=A0A3P7N4W5_CYLGO|nr:unnamed protein product [Cylicostephanus goldi]
MASRLEKCSLPGKIHCSEKTYKYATQTGRFEFTNRGRVFIKGKVKMQFMTVERRSGDVETYFLIRSTKKSNTIDGYEELETGMPVSEQQQTVILPPVAEKSKTCSIS